MSNTTIIEVKDIIRERRLSLGLSYSELGKKCEVDKTTVRKWELGLIENMRRDKMMLLSKALNVSPLVLLGIEDNTAPNEVDTSDKIKVYDSLSENAIDEIPHPYPQQKGDFFALKVKDQQISNLLATNIMYFIFKQKATVKNGDTVAVDLGNKETLIKKFYKFDDVLVLQPTNENTEPITIVGHEMNEMCILGKLVAVISPFID